MSNPETVITVEEVEALPPNSVLLDLDGFAWQKDGGLGVESWTVVGSTELERADEIPTPARVLHWGN